MTDKGGGSNGFKKANSREEAGVGSERIKSVSQNKHAESGTDYGLKLRLRLSAHRTEAVHITRGGWKSTQSFTLTEKGGGSNEFKKVNSREKAGVGSDAARGGR